jgi:hypothetical protein
LGAKSIFVISPLILHYGNGRWLNPGLGWQFSKKAGNGFQWLYLGMQLLGCILGLFLKMTFLIKKVIDILFEFDDENITD